MFNRQQIQHLDRTYFEVLQQGCFGITLRSKNTGHYGYITGTGYGDSVSISHKHKWEYSWHPQAFYIKTRHSLNGAISAIKAHDEYVIAKERRHR